MERAQVQAACVRFFCSMGKCVLPNKTLRDANLLFNLGLTGVVKFDSIVAWFSVVA